MTKRIVCAGQKGGVGKSTVARALAVRLTEKGQNVILADMDFGQRTCAEWTAARNHNNLSPAIRVEVVDIENDGFHVPDADKADIVIYDCPGWSDTHTAGAAGFADLLILPTGPGQDDLRPLIRLCHELAQGGTDLRRVALVLVRTHTPAEVKDARKYVLSAELGIGLVDGEIQEGVSATKGHGVGQSVIESGGDKQRAAALTLMDALIERLETAPALEQKTDWAKLDWSVV